MLCSALVGLPSRQAAADAPSASDPISGNRTAEGKAAEPRCDGGEVNRNDMLMADYAARARAYYFGWGGVSLALAAGQLAAALAVTDRGLAIDFSVGAATSAVGDVATLLQPPPLLFYTPGGLAFCSRRLEQRTLLERTVAFESSQRSWLAHGIGVAAGLVSGGILWFGYGRPVSGLGQLAGTVALNELQIWTVPRGLPTPLVSVSAVGGQLDLAWSL